MSTENFSSAAPLAPRFPSTAAGIQVNHCKNPVCKNFGVPPKAEATVPVRGRRPKSAPGPEPGDYLAINVQGQQYLKCQLCGESIPLQSNLAIAEELLRISRYLEPETPACPNPACTSFGKAEASGEATYVRFGETRHGTPRYRCNGCRKVFSFGGKSTKRQRRTHVNRDVFEHLVNSVPLRRIIKLLGISPDTLYTKLDFIYKQCQLFAGARERTLINRADLDKRYLATDRQKFVVNWSSRKDRRNTQLLSIATADLVTGYVFAANLNYDPDLQYAQVAEDAAKYGDPHLTRPFRRYARVWLPEEFEAAAQATPLLQPREAAELAATITQAYEAAGARLDIEAGEGAKRSARTPIRGVQLHETAVMNAHIQFVCRLLTRAPKLRFYMDQESGLRAAFMAAVPGRIKDKTADAYYVSVAKNQTVDQKRGLVQAALRRLKEFQKDSPGLSDEVLKILLMRQEMARPEIIGQFKDPWVNHPVSDMREPEKKVCWLTDIEPLSEDPDKRENQINHAARLFLRASLFAVDRFFMQIRRGITMAERGIVSASSDRRLWFGKNAYDPGHLAKLLEIYRVYFNYCEVGEDKKTPAMRLGLARGPVASEDILYFTPEPPVRKRAASGLRTAHEESPPLGNQKGASNEAVSTSVSTP